MKYVQNYNVDFYLILFLKRMGYIFHRWVTLEWYEILSQLIIHWVSILYDILLKTIFLP